MRLLLALVAAYAWADVSAIRVWGSDLLVWQQAHAVAVTSPRAAMNYAKALVAVGRSAEALAVARQARAGP